MFFLVENMMSSEGQKMRWAETYQLDRAQFEDIMSLAKLDTDPLKDATYKALGPKAVAHISKACEYRLRMNIPLFALMDILEPYLGGEEAGEKVSETVLLDVVKKSSKMVFDLFNGQVLLHKREQQRQTDLMVDRVRDQSTKHAVKMASYSNMNSGKPPLEQFSTHMSNVQTVKQSLQKSGVSTDREPGGYAPRGGARGRGAPWRGKRQVSATKFSFPSKKKLSSAW